MNRIEEIRKEITRKVKKLSPSKIELWHEDGRLDLSLFLAEKIIVKKSYNHVSLEMAMVLGNAKYEKIEPKFAWGINY